MTDVGGHRADIAGLHHDPRPNSAGIAVLDLPGDLVAQLQEPLDPVVAVDDRENVLLGRRAEQRVLADAHDRRVPCDIGAREVCEEAERRYLALESGLDLDHRLALIDIAEHAVDWEAGVVAADLLIIRYRDHAIRGDSAARDGTEILTVLDAECGAGLVRRRERIEGLIRPVGEDRLEGLANLRGLDVLAVVEFGLSVRLVVAAGEDIDGAVVVHRAEDTVEVHDAIEEVPGDIALQGSQECIGAHDVAAGRPADVDEELVTAEGELAERELVVALGIRALGLRDLDV